MTVSRASSRLLFGEALRTPATAVDRRPVCSNNSVCNLILSTSSAFLRFWLNDACRGSLLAHTEIEDLANIRLVCHDFSARAAPALFKSVTVTFKPSSFSKPARIGALSRIGRHVKTFTLYLPHGPDTFLPPVVDPVTGEEKQFIYEPQVQNRQDGPAKDKTPKYGTWEMQDLLVKQYPPLFHAATNVPAFVATFSELVNLTHLKVSCTGLSNATQHHRSIADYALISLRIAIERAPVHSLSSLSLHPIYPSGLLHFHPMHSLGGPSPPSKCWGQIRHLSICMQSISCFSPSRRTRTQSSEHLRILHTYLRTFSRSLTRLVFCWKGELGPSPLSLDREPYILPVGEESVHPSMREEVLRPLKFSRLRYLELENVVMDCAQTNNFIHRHRRTLQEIALRDFEPREGNRDDMLRPLTQVARSDQRKRCQEKVMDVPIMLGPVEEPRVMGLLFEDADATISESAFDRYL